MRLLVCGGLRIDYLITPVGEVRLRQMGGNAIYAAVGARVWTERVALLAKAGENYPSEWLDELAAHGLSTEAVRHVPGWQEMRTFYAYPDPETRVDRDPALHFARVGHPLPPDLEDYVNSVVGQQDVARPDPLMLGVPDVPPFAGQLDAVHLAPLGPLSQRDLAVAFKGLGVPQLSLDPGEVATTPDTAALLRESCAVTDAFLPSELEVRLLCGDVDVRVAAEELASWGSPVVAIKRGAAGCLLYERDANRFTTIPAYPARVVDVTGAGDSFCGGFSAGLRRTGDPLRAALMGTVSASFTVEGYGALYTLGASRHEAERRLEALAGATTRI